MSRTVTGWVVLAVVGWSFVMYVMWGSWREPYAGRILCPEGMPNCHDVERPPFALWWVVGLLVILVVVWIVGRLRVGRA
jgi:hypothetical protein